MYCLSLSEIVHEAKVTGLHGNPILPLCMITAPNPKELEDASADTFVLAIGL